jgi:predicted O-linked N-acetylglucosamine transferase (SPINDLY family)
MAESRFQEAEKMIARAINAAPENADYLVQLGELYSRMRRSDLAQTTFSRALAIDPCCAGGYAGLGRLMRRLGKLEEGLGFFECAKGFVSVDGPDSDSGSDDVNLRVQTMIAKSHALDWSDQETVADAVSSASFSTNFIEPEDVWPLLDDPDLIWHVSQRHDRGFGRPRARSRSVAMWGRGDQRLRLGFFGDDLFARQDLAEVLHQIDGDRFETSLFDYGRRHHDGYPTDVHQAADHSRTVLGYSDSSVLAVARDDRLDVAFDLKGFQGVTRQGLMGNGLAPVQINWAGVPAFQGRGSADYVIVDDALIGPEYVPEGAEKLITLPCFRYLNRAANGADPLGKFDEKRLRNARRVEMGVPDGVVLLATPMAANAVSRENFGCWVEILRRNPDTVLWVRFHHPLACSNAVAALCVAGIGPERVVVGSGSATQCFIHDVGLADIALDSFCASDIPLLQDALRTGTPVVSLAGRTMAARVGHSMLKSASLPDLSVTTPQDYVALVTSLTRDRYALTTLRLRVRAVVQFAPLFDVGQFVMALEDAIEKSVSLHRNGRPPNHIWSGGSH